jgi:hypothetical protein
MPRSPSLAALLAAAFAVHAPPAPAQGVYAAPPPQIAREAPLTGIRASIARDLPYFGFRDVDVRALRLSQAAQIHYLIHSGRSRGDIRRQIRSTLKGGLIQRAIERAIR